MKIQGWFSKNKSEPEAENEAPKLLEEHTEDATNSNEEAIASDDQPETELPKDFPEKEDEHPV